MIIYINIIYIYVYIIIYDYYIIFFTLDIFYILTFKNLYNVFVKNCTFIQQFYKYLFCKYIYIYIYIYI